MKKLKTTARVTEVDAVSDTLLRLYQTEMDSDSAIAHDAYLATTFSEIGSLSSQITTAIKREKMPSCRDELDRNRDKAIRQLGTALTGYAALPIDSKKSAAEKLLAIYNKYGKRMINENYASKSSLISSLLEDLKDASNAPAFEELVGTYDLVVALENAQKDFLQQSDAYNAATVQKNQQENATKLKKPLLSAINDKLIPYLTAMNLAQPAIFAAFVAQAESEILRVNQIISKRTKTTTEPKEMAPEAEQEEIDQAPLE